MDSCPKRIKIMTEVWGLMPKNQDDAEKIEEAINRIVAEHNADPTAHLGAGQSIEVHREQSVIDHKAGSVLADKWTFSELEFSTYFETLTPFYTVGDVYPQFPGALMEPTGTGYSNRAELQIDGESAQLGLDFSKEQLFQTVFSADMLNSGEIYAGLFSESVSTIKKGFGFQIIAGVFKFFASNEAVDTFNYLQFEQFEPLTTYIIRMHYSPVDGKILCYVDGELIGELEWPSDTWQGDAVIRFIAIDTVLNSISFYPKSLYFKVSKP